MDLNDNEKVHILLSNINIVRKTSNYLNEVFNEKYIYFKKAIIVIKSFYDCIMYLNMT